MMERGNECAMCRVSITRASEPQGMILEKVDLWHGIPAEVVPLCGRCYGRVQPHKPPVRAPWGPVRR